MHPEKSPPDASPNLIRGVALGSAVALNMIDMIGVGPSIAIPLIGALQVRWLISGATFVAIGMVVLATILLYRKITSIGWISKLLLAGVLVTIGWIIVAGLTHFDASRAFSFPAGAFTLSRNFFLGLGSAMLVATYDYWGYYNVCFLGDEVKEPAKTIPRALL